MYKSPDNVWHVMLGYGYGIDAIRHNDRGAHSIGILLQYNLEADLKSTKPFWNNWLNPNT